MKIEKTKKITSIGGQALIEGIMMRGPKKTCMAVRRCDTGEIVLEDIKVVPLKEKYPVCGYPFIRGIVSFIESLTLGYKTLTLSAEKSGFEETENPSKFDLWLEKHLNENAMKVVMGISTVLGLLLALTLFFWLPTFLFNLVESFIPADISLWRSLFEGILRIVMFLVYVLFCSMIKDVRRVFEYHGAEHKTIFCYENDEELTVENVRKHTRFHPRCGTSFMVIILLIGVVVGFFIPFTNPFLRTFAKILCIPIIVGVGYEIIKICGRYDNTFTRIISAPGKWMQRITTKEPDDKMIEVAIEAMKAVIPENGEDIICK